MTQFKDCQFHVQYKHHTVYCRITNLVDWKCTSVLNQYRKAYSDAIDKNHKTSKNINKSYLSRERDKLFLFPLQRCSWACA